MPLSTGLSKSQAGNGIRALASMGVLVNHSASTPPGRRDLIATRCRPTKSAGLVMFKMVGPPAPGWRDGQGKLPCSGIFAGYVRSPWADLNWSRPQTPWRGWAAGEAPDKVCPCAETHRRALCH